MESESNDRWLFVQRSSVYPHISKVCSPEASCEKSNPSDELAVITVLIDCDQVSGSLWNLASRLNCLFDVNYYPCFLHTFVQSRQFSEAPVPRRRKHSLPSLAFRAISRQDSWLLFVEPPFQERLVSCSAARWRFISR